MQYVLWSRMHQKFWRPMREGYTSEIDEAGRYSDNEALSICKESVMPDGSRRTVPLTAPEMFGEVFGAKVTVVEGTYQS